MPLGHDLGSGTMPAASPGVLWAGFRTQPMVPHRQNYWNWHRAMGRAAYQRDAPGQVFQVERSLFQPVQIPAKIQVDVNPEYSTAYRAMPGYIGYLERVPYVQGQQGQSTMSQRPQYWYTVQPPRFSTLPAIFGVGG